MLKLLLPALLVLPPVTAGATELRQMEVRTGTDGLLPADIVVANRTGTALSCNADIAHWYSLELATAAPGATAVIALWFDPATGTFAALNDKRENMPVERLWCGISGRAYETRALLALDRAIGSSPAARSVSCSMASAKVECRG